MKMFLGCCGILALAAVLPAQEAFETDSFSTAGGELTVTFVGHGTLMFTWAGKVIHVDPVSREADYTRLPAADLILITHAHSDHLDEKAVAAIRKGSTRIVLTREAADKLGEGEVLANGESLSLAGIVIEAVPAYNTTSGRERFHPPGRDNGYLLTFADLKVYVAGDTENHPGLMALRDIDVAFLPMNQPYTMTPEQVAAAARAMKPRVLYPYHFGDTDTERLLELLRDVPEVEVRLRELD
jgi:L-ascorbate metabolism protein UlaG (beta-lactamase superfamily)